MSSQRWRQIEELFHAATEVDPEVRAEFVDRACGSDFDLRRQVESLLRLDPQVGSFLESHSCGVEPTNLPAGRQVGPYMILSPLGGGGMGEVYRAHDSKLGRDVALKTLPAEFAGDPERLARLRREARTLASLNHPNIAAIYGLEESPAATCLVLELVEGETLRGPLPLGQALDYARQVADALQAAHTQGVIHRDLKPSNVKVSPQGRVKVLDFGLAKAVWGADKNPDPPQRPDVRSVQTAAGQITGTPPYMSPEQARGQAVDQRTDIWSFGCLLYELLTGRRAFCGETVADTIAAVLDRGPDWGALPPKTPARVRELIRRCLEKDITRRVHEIADIRAILEHSTNGWRLATVASAATAALAVSGLLWLRLTVRAAERTPAPTVNIAGSAGQPTAGEYPAPANSIAVLPFSNLSSDPEADYLGEGLAEELIQALGKVAGLRVVGRTSSFQFKGKPDDLRQIGKRLQARLVLEGGVQKAGNRLRVTAQLIDTTTGFHVWSERFDRKFGDVFAIQDEICEAIARALSVNLSGRTAAWRGPHQGQNPEVYTLYLKGLKEWNRRNRDGVEKSRDFFERALALDPTCAPAGRDSPIS